MTSDSGPWIPGFPSCSVGPASWGGLLWLVRSHAEPKEVAGRLVRVRFHRYGSLIGAGASAWHQWFPERKTKRHRD